MEKETKFPGIIEIILLFFAAYLVVYSSASFYAGMIGHSSPEEIESMLLSSKVFLFFSQVFIFLIPVIYFKKKQYDLKSLFYIRPVSGKNMGISLAFAIGLLPLMDELDRLVQLIFRFEEIPDNLFLSFKFSSLPEFLLIFLTIVILGPIFEEFFFRGVLLQSAIKRFGLINAIIFSALFWTGIHAILNWTLQIFILGLLLAIITWQYRSTIPAIIVHAVNNLFSLIMLNVEESAISPYYEWNGHVHWAWLILGMAILFFSGKKLFAPVQTSS